MGQGLHQFRLPLTSLPLFCGPSGEHRVDVDLKAVVVEPGSVGERLTQTQRLGHGGDERDGTGLVGVEQGGELFGVVEGWADDLRQGSAVANGGTETVWKTARHSDLPPEADMRARGQRRCVHGNLRREPARNDKRWTRNTAPHCQSRMPLRLPHEYGIMRPATRLVLSGVGLAAVQVLRAPERLCHFWSSSYWESGQQSSVMQRLRGVGFHTPNSLRSERCYYS